MGDPIRSLRMQNRAAIVLSVAGVAAVALWTFWPVDPSTDDDSIQISQATESNTASIRHRTDWDAFDVALWQPFAQPVAAEPPKPPPSQPAPSPLELLAIATDAGDVFTAILYDSATHKIHRVASGESIGAHRIAGVDAAGVDLELAGQSSRLALRREVP